jgi:hypothetical protein
MKRYMRARVAGFIALLASALAVLAATAAPALAKGYMLIPGSHVSTNPGVLYAVAALSVLSITLMGMTVVIARRQRRLARVETARSTQTRLAPADKPSWRRAA